MAESYQPGPPEALFSRTTQFRQTGNGLADLLVDLSYPGTVRTVLLVDDDKDLRFMLRYLIESTTNFEVVGEAGNGEEAIEQTRKLQPDLIVMDVAMPVIDGLEATKRIKELWPRTYVLGLTAFSDYPEAMLGSGATRCLLKTDAYGSLTSVMERLKDEADSGTAWY